MGYKVHLSESCDQNSPHLITHIETTPAPVVDGESLVSIHEALQKKGLLPCVHLVDTGYIYAHLLVGSQQNYGVDLLGPTRCDYHWQSQAKDGFAARDFLIDWENQSAICPQGQTSNSWTPLLDKNDNSVFKIQFAQSVCRSCEAKPRCTRAARRSLLVQPRVLHEALLSARQRETTVEYQQQYRKRAGVEGTISQGVRAFGLRRSRYVGLVKTHLQHVLTAIAINCSRLSQWWEEKSPAQTRKSAFVRLCAA